MTDLEKAWKERKKLKKKRLYNSEKVNQFPKEKHKRDNISLKTSIKELIPKETLQKLMSI